MKKLISIIAMLMAICMGAVILTGCASTAEFDASTKITVVVRDTGSGTRSAFMEIIGLSTTDAPSNAVEQTSTSGVIAAVKSDTYAIGYVSLGSLSDDVIALKVGGVEVSAENIISGDYEVARPLNVMYDTTQSGDNADLMNDFITFMDSSEAQDMADSEGFVSDPDKTTVYGTTADATIAALSGDAAKISVSGSTSVEPLMQAIAEAYKEIYSNVTISISASGSGAGVSDIAAGNVDIGMASRVVAQSEVGDDVTISALAQDGIAVIVNSENAYDDITLEQLAGIFGSDETISTWDGLDA